MTDKELLKIMCIAYESVRSEACHEPSMKLALDIVRSAIESQERDRCIKLYKNYTDDTDQRLKQIVGYIEKGFCYEQ